MPVSVLATATNAHRDVQECEQQRVAADENAWQRASFRYKFAVHALLSGDHKAVDTLLRVRLCVCAGARLVLKKLHCFTLLWCTGCQQQGSSVLATIEGLMWFMTALVRQPPASQTPRSTPGALLVLVTAVCSRKRPTCVRRSCIRAAGRLVERFKLADLQSYLTQFPPSHSQDGKEPLLYAALLLLGLQFQGLVSFLAEDPTACSYRVDAPLFAIAFVHHQVCTPATSQLGRPLKATLQVWP